MRLLLETIKDALDHLTSEDTLELAKTCVEYLSQEQVQELQDCIDSSF